MTSLATTFALYCAVCTLNTNEPVDVEWQPYHEVMLLTNVVGMDVDGETVMLRRAFVLHRDDLEKVQAMSARIQALEKVLADRAPPDPVPSFWDTPWGYATLVAIGAVAGGVAVGVGAWAASR